MRHPFEGILFPEQHNASHATPSTADVNGMPEVRNEANPPASRRTFLRGLGALAAVAGGTLAVTGAATAQDRRLESQEPSPDGRTRHQPPQPRHSDQDFTTQALGEEGGRGEYTTQALGEEGGRGGEPDRATTYALGEEGGQDRDGEWATTYALGEEAGQGDGRDRYRYTTYALGEEGSWGGGYYWRRRWYPPRYQFDWPSWNRWHDQNRYTTQALGEEGGWRY